ncbi:DUF397 domain-containing protein [Actinomadura geliboluensis]|uniref:DUF397 domain-containing protein n=1 Tax=Actinomadura geliboluensis TaxID=882440 RepID=UPI0036ACACFD
MTNPDPSRITWRKSRRSNNGGNCVEIGALTGMIGVRDSKAPDDGYLSLSPQNWTAFVSDVREGRYDLP